MSGISATCGFAWLVWLVDAAPVSVLMCKEACPARSLCVSDSSEVSRQLLFDTHADLFRVTP